VDTNDQETRQETGTSANRWGEQLQIGPFGKQLLTGTTRIKTRQIQQTIAIHMVTRNQSTSLPDEDWL